VKLLVAMSVASSSAREWLFIDAVTKSQKGPVAAEVLSKMLDKGVMVTGSTFVWKPGMDSWKSMAEVTPRISTSIL
jgi:GYF domain 2